MTFYKSIAYFSPSKEVRTEQDILEAVKQLKGGYERLGLGPSITKGEYLSKMRKALQNKENTIEIDLEKVNEIDLKEVINISPLIQAIKNYEHARIKACFNCESFVDKYETLERKQYCKLDRSRKLPLGECQEGFKNKFLDKDSKPLDEILKEI